jgi:hypothetical protein
LQHRHLKLKNPEGDSSLVRTQWILYRVGRRSKLSRYYNVRDDNNSRQEGRKELLCNCRRWNMDKNSLRTESKQCGQVKSLWCHPQSQALLASVPLFPASVCLHVIGFRALCPWWGAHSWSIYWRSVGLLLFATYPEDHPLG